MPYTHGVGGSNPSSPTTIAHHPLPRPSPTAPRTAPAPGPAPPRVVAPRRSRLRRARLRRAAGGGGDEARQVPRGGVPALLAAPPDARPERGRGARRRPPGEAGPRARGRGTRHDPAARAGRRERGGPRGGGHPPRGARGRRRGAVPRRRRDRREQAAGRPLPRWGGDRRAPHAPRPPEARRAPGASTSSTVSTRDTSGVVVLVRDPALRRALSEAFAEDAAVEKVYDALVEGLPAEDAGVVDLPLADPGHGTRGRVDRARPPRADRMDGRRALRRRRAAPRRPRDRSHAPDPAAPPGDPAPAARRPPVRSPGGVALRRPEGRPRGAPDADPVARGGDRVPPPADGDARARQGAALAGPPARLQGAARGGGAGRGGGGRGGGADRRPSPRRAIRASRSRP